MNERKQFEMTEEQLARIYAACKPVALVAIHCGPIRHPQDRINSAWESLGRELGFKHMSVRPVEGLGDKFFTAEVASHEPE